MDPGGSVRAAEVTADNVHSLAFPVSRATVAAQGGANDGHAQCSRSGQSPGTTSQVSVSSAEMTKIEFEAKRIEKAKGSLYEKQKTLTAKIPNDLVKSAIHVSHMQHCKHLLACEAMHWYSAYTRHRYS